jgi:hypothetical protein
MEHRVPPRVQPIIQPRSLKECSGRTARMATERSRVVIGGYCKGGYCKECLRRREADIVSSMSLWPARLSLPVPRPRFHRVSWLGREASK